MIQYDLNQIQDVVRAFQQSKIIAMPTDTVYGVGVLFDRYEDLEKLKHCKHRPETKPIPVMVADINQMAMVAKVDERIRKLVKTFLPGPMTLVVPVKDDMDPRFTNGLKTIAIRIPDYKFILDVLQQLGKPLFVTSANQSGQKTALTYDDVLEQLPNIDGLVMGTCQQLQASTIVDCTGTDLKILREGPISLSQIQSALCE